MISIMLAMIAAQGLDAPINAQPTVRSEIRRGYVAGEECNNRAQGGHSMIYYDCIKAVETRNQERMSNGFQAFNLGLYLRAKEDGKVFADLAPGYKLLFTPQDVALLQAELKLYESRYDDGLKQLRLGDDDAKKAAFFGP